jgi:nucleoid-associated protein YgaU
MAEKAEEDRRAAEAREKAKLQAENAVKHGSGTPDVRAVEAREKAILQAENAAKEAAAKASAEEAAKPKVLKMHTIAPGETLSHLALRYYGFATPEYWKLIIEANKAELGEDIKHYGPGKTIIIPVLPDAMKKKK